MKIAIHHRPGSFSDRWIEYCEKEGIDYKIVNCYDSDIVKQMKDCDVLMWHHNNYDYRDALFAKQLIYSLETIGIRVFPNFNTTWHFDDKVGQKYLLESIGAPTIPSFIFYSKEEAIEWIRRANFPKVFKLRGGSGSSNVELIKNRKHAKRLTNKAFGTGFAQFNRFTHLKFRYKNFRAGKENFIAVLKGVTRLFIGSKYSNNYAKEKGYIYIQEFIPENTFDIRVIVIGDKAFALKRLVRDNDFRASGGGKIIYNKAEIDERCVQIAFAVNEKLKAQSIAYDFVFDPDGKPLIVEISYGFDVHAYDLCEGYWDESLNWNAGEFNPQKWMIEEILKSI